MRNSTIGERGAHDHLGPYNDNDDYYYDYQQKHKHNCKQRK